MPNQRTKRPAVRHPLVAAVDLGSNSFHLIVARLDGGGRPQVVDRLRERVALGAGMGADKRLTPESMRRALAGLRRFGQRLHAMPRGSVRAVGTNALRTARNARGFLVRAEKALGHPIEVVSGREEARLIHLGVVSNLPLQPGRLLVVDIGGGSTECIVGEGLRPVLADSLFMGCVSWSERFFPGGRLTRGGYAAARLAAEVELEPIAARYRAARPGRAVGSAGTIVAVQSVLRALGHGPAIGPAGVKALVRQVLAARRLQRLRLPGLSEDRRDVFVGGLAILDAVLRSFDIDELEVSSASLREGLLADLVGRLRHEDARERSVAELGARWQLDGPQAARVERTALALLGDARARLGLGGEEPERLLRWACRMHELGLAIAYSKHHLHGAYILRHADLPGFARDEQALLAALVAGHRRRLSPALFDEWPAARARVLLRLLFLLRLAVALHRARGEAPLRAPKLVASPGRITLRFRAGQLARHPLWEADLRAEADWLAELGWRLRWS